MRPIDADELKKDLTRFYDNEVTAKQLIDEQPTIEPEQRWIPVTERLPEPYYEVWCCSDIGQVLGYRDVNGLWFGRGDLELLVVAWMPLPEPYQGGEQE